MSNRKKKPNDWLPLHIDAWRTKTRRLSLVERCAYLELLLEYWDTQGPLEVDHDDFANLIGITRQEWDQMAERVLRFFSIGDDGLLHNRRMDEEIKKAKRIMDQKIMAGRIGGKASASKRQASAKADAQAGAEADASILTSKSEAHASAGAEQAAEQAGQHPRGLQVSETVGSQNAFIPRFDEEVESLVSELESEWDKDSRLVKLRADARKKASANKYRGVS